MQGVAVELADELFQKGIGNYLKKWCLGRVIDLSYPFRFLNVYIYLFICLFIYKMNFLRNNS